MRIKNLFKNGLNQVLMKVCGAILIFLLAVQIFGKKENMSRPGATFVIREHQTGANMLEITLLEPSYPPDLLKRQIQKMTEIVNSYPRGLEMYYHQLSPDQPKLRFLKAVFAMDGLIRVDKQTFRLEPILKAFAGTPDPFTLHSISVHFVGKKTGPKTLRAFSSKAVDVKGNVHTEPQGVEYFIEYHSQHPDEIKVPEEVLFLKQRKNHSISSKNDWNHLKFWGLLGASLAFGIGIYFGLTKYILYRSKS